MKNVIVLYMLDIYTPIEEAGEIIRKRWADKDLRKKVEVLLLKLNLTGISSSNEVLECGTHSEYDYCPPDDDECNP